MGELFALLRELWLDFKRMDTADKFIVFFLFIFAPIWAPLVAVYKILMIKPLRKIYAFPIYYLSPFFISLQLKAFHWAANNRR